MYCTSARYSVQVPDVPVSYFDRFLWLKVATCQVIWLQVSVSYQLARIYDGT